jgi:hypothetical protein
MRSKSHRQQSSFRFSNEDRICLLRAWHREDDHEKADALIDALEPRVGMWLALYSPGPTRGEIKKGLVTVEKAAHRLQNVLQTYYAELAGGLNPPLTDEIRLNELHPRTLEIIKTGSAKQYLVGSDVIDTINLLLDFLLMATREEIDILKNTTKRGPDGQGVWLVCMAAKLYRIIFGSDPKKYSENDNPSNFQKFISELVTILREYPGYEGLVIGKSPYNQGIAQDCFLPPASKVYVSTP